MTQVHVAHSVSVPSLRRPSLRALGLLSVLMAVACLVGCRSGGGSSEEQGSSAADGSGPRQVRILNVSYDPTRELYEEYNAHFARQYEQEHNVRLTIEMSHGGSGRQARSVEDGLEADVVTLALEPDIDSLVPSGLIEAGWKAEFPNNSSAYTSTQVFIVRRGNPKNIRTWDDLVREDVSVVVPNPKTSGGARWIYVAAWGWALRQPGGTAESARDFVGRLYRNVPVLDSGARGSTTTFARNGIGDVLVSWENEAHLLTHEMAAEGFEVVVPTASVLCDPPIAIVDRIADRRGTREIVQAYLQGLYSDEAQRMAARRGYRPSNPAIAAEFVETFPPLELFRVEDVLGSWEVVQTEHFGDGGIFDQIYAAGAGGGRR